MRQCGPCSFCCKVLAISELEKPAGTWCTHVIKGRGCGAYETRPEACRTFTCGWLVMRELDEAWQPHRARFMLRTEPGQLYIDVDPGFPAAWRAAPYYAKIKEWARTVQAKRQCIVVQAGPNATIVFPEADVDIGPYDTGDVLHVGYRTVEGRKRPMVRRMDGETVVREWLGPPV